MSKSFYSDYISHCLRFYCRNQQAVAMSACDKKNWLACDSVLRSLSDAENEIIFRVYLSRGSVNDALASISNSTGHSVDDLWKLVKNVERKIAEERGLV